MSDITTAIDTYLNAYGESDATRRRADIACSWEVDGTLVDPPMDATGHEALDVMFAAVQGQFPGHSFRRTSAIDAHHGIARYSWDLVAPDGTVAVTGMDVARVSDAGKLVDVAGFFGPLPELDT